MILNSRLRDLATINGWKEIITSGDRAYIVDRFKSMSDYSVIGVDPSTVCQYTGVIDYDGNEIWEHDLIDNTPYWHKVNSDEREICEVTFLHLHILHGIRRWQLRDLDGLLLHV